jgi:hypothetical protein
LAILAKKSAGFPAGWEALIISALSWRLQPRSVEGVIDRYFPVVKPSIAFHVVQ